MFGGENHIPDSVKAAMKLEDYGKGKPLTARRILAVKAAIDADGTYDRLLATFGNANSENFAKNKGWSAAELPKLARAAHILSSITGRNDLEAIAMLSTPDSMENRLLNYGGRFLENAASFRDGLRPLNAFSVWFTGVNEALAENGGAQGERKEGMSPTLLNASCSSFTAGMLRGMEKFVFECIAHDPSFDLSGTDHEKLFGMENNVVTHFFGRQLHDACTQTIAQVPPEKRKTFFSAVTMFFPLVDNAADANIPGKKRGEPMDVKMAIARVLKHLDKIAGLEARGELTFENVARLVVPELPPDSECGFAEVGKALSDVVLKVAPTFAKKGST